MKSRARLADSARSSRPSTRAATAMPRIISAFHEVRTLSSRAGGTRRARSARCVDERGDLLRGPAGRTGDVLDGSGHAQVPAALEVGWSVEPEARREHRELLGAQRGAHLVRVPDVELAFVAFG